MVGPDGVKFDFLRSSSKESKVRAIRSTARDMIRTGTVAYCDFREGGIEGVELLRAANPPTIRAVVLSRPTKPEDVTKLLRNSDGIGLPSLDSFEWEKVKTIAREAKRSDKLFAVHVAETEGAQKKSEESTGRTEVERALELDPSFLVHGTWATEEDFEAMRREDVPLVVCGRSNNLLCSGDPPLKTAMEKGVEIWIGTDNATVCQPDIFRELSFSWAALRLHDSKAGSEEARELLKAATINPNSGLGLPFGPIEEGANAAFTVLARDGNLQRLDDLYTGLVNRARPDNIRTLFCPS
ncbi:hypothetical protein AKJ45_03685 [candidate division MSBL1 archaeon SCGC-AAA261F19]|uniref:Amidohydrolase-related domain-containing protein n=1 Tax=candidate division MSBL1 archaeon SCGC-AAA261F19 TaxID=1698275 RepID=A0A133V6R8_9EURY|nr:hypothetical protein AKJ45_03685 [candidate division MSBL1 archaeon SCGC-AAA261F19]